MKWNLIAEGFDPQKGEIVLLATERGVLGKYSGRTVDKHGVTWFIDDSYYDGDDDPKYWILLPPIPC